MKSVYRRNRNNIFPQTRRVLLDMKKDKYLKRKDQKIRRKKNDVQNPLIPENEIYEADSSHVARRIAKRSRK